MATERLDQHDSFLWEAEARVVAIAEWKGRPSVVLDRSVFYPESGGQMADHGTLDGVGVVDVQIDSDGRVHHRVEGALPEVGATVVGRVDGPRRYEHMTLHTAQHMLSRALLDVADAETVSSRLGESAATIDLDRVVSEAQATEARDRVQAAIDADRSVRALHPTDDELASMALRRLPKVTEGIRILEVEGFDLTPCGGTHCTRTAQIGIVHLTALQGYKGGTRVTFVAGPRARRLLVAQSALVGGLAQRFTCAPGDVPAAIDKLERRLDEARGSLGAARAGWAGALADQLRGQTFVARAFDALDRETVRALAKRLTEAGSTVVALAAKGAEGTHVVVARGPDSDFDCGAFLKRLAKAAGGGGGGRPERAEGRLPADVDWERIVTEATEGE